MLNDPSKDGEKNVTETSRLFLIKMDYQSIDSSFYLCGICIYLHIYESGTSSDFFKIDLDK